jgi:hypothetical protein
MAEAEDTAPESDSPSQQTEKVGRYLTVGILARFMRITYGKQAIIETERRIAAYANAGKFDLAEVWRRVLVQLTGYDPTAETRRIFRARRPLKVRT